MGIGSNPTDRINPTEVPVRVTTGTKWRLIPFDHLALPLTLAKAAWTQIYLYTGSGYLHSLWFELSTKKIDLRITVDTTEVILPEYDLSRLAKSGKQTVTLPLVHLDSNNFAFTPQEKVRFNKEILVEMKTNNGSSGGKKLNDGYIALTKET